MARLDFNPQAYQYSQGLKAIELMWTAAKQALSNRQAEVEREIAEYRFHVESGGKPIGEWDGPHLLYDHEDELRLELLVLDDAIAEINRAVVIAIYHHWERHVPNRSNEKDRKHHALVNALNSERIAIHPAFDALYFSANFLKHGNPYWLKKLNAGFAQDFPQLEPPEGEGSIGWSHLKVTDDHVSWFLEIANVSKRPIVGEL